MRSAGAGGVISASALEDSRRPHGSADHRPLRGRQRELGRLLSLFREASAGRGATLVVRGEPGIGKTALMAEALREASGLQVLRAAGAEFEMELPFAALHALCAPVLGSAAALPSPQRAALEAAFGIRDDGSPDPLLVGLAVLGLLSECGQQQTVACVIDDAQWLDEASAHALLFAARRIESERVAVIFSMREDAGQHELAALPELWLEGLSDEEAVLLLESEIHVQMDQRIRDRIIAEARGNPLALLEMPRTAGGLEVAGGFAVSELRATASQIEDSFIWRMAELPPETQLLLVVAAAEPLGDPTLLWSAVSRLGIAPRAAAPAEAAGLLEIDRQVRFRHPLVRSAIYGAAPLDDRRRAHDVLAQATDPISDPDRRAWRRAQARGGLAAAAAFTERAAELTPDPARRAARMLTAARIAQSAGALDTSLRLLSTAESGPLDDDARAGARLQRAQIAFQTTRDDRSAAMLLEAANALDGDDSREAYLEAFMAAMVVRRFSPGRLLEVAQAARARPVREPRRPLDMLLDGLSTHFSVGCEAAVPAMRSAVAALRNEGGLGADDLRWLMLACIVAIELRDDEAHGALAEQQVQQARAAGALALLPTYLNLAAGAFIVAGELANAGALVGEAYAIAAATGSADLVYGDLTLSGWRGDKRRLGELVAGIQPVVARGEGSTPVYIEYATAVLNNGLGDYQAALDATTEAGKYDELGLNAFASPERVEAAARLGRPDLAAEAVERLSARARICETDWAAGMELRARALLSDGPEADALYREAIDRLSRTRLEGYVARTQLVYGEWLRRQRRRADAREQLGDAHESLSRMGGRAFARRAARELQPTGEPPRQRSSDALDTLTVQELNIARRAASGETSKEIAASLFLSPRTIDAHLRSIFRKTGVTSRRQLREVTLWDHENDPTVGASL